MFLYSVSMMILTLNEVKSIGNIQPDQVKSTCFKRVLSPEHVDVHVASMES